MPGAGGKLAVFVGTSGWLYDWNPQGSLDWYVAYSGLNAVELNASFYRFPYPNQVLSWTRRGASLRWAVKVHRSITHTRRLSEKALPVFDRFRRLFQPMDRIIDFYLFQLPPSYKKTGENIRRVKLFAEKTGLGERMAVEFRHETWFDQQTVELAESLGITLVSIDSPQATWIVASNRIVYARLHGRTGWYFHDYSREELEEIAERIASLSPRRVYVFFNNNHWMLENARRFKKLLEEKTG